MIPAEHVLAWSAALFAVGAVGALSRRNLLVVLMSIVWMGNAVHLALVGFARGAGAAEAAQGQAFALLAIVVGLAEAVVGVAVLVALVRGRDSLDARDASLLKW